MPEWIGEKPVLERPDAETAAAQLTCGEAIIRLLEDYAVDTLFGIPGCHTLGLYLVICQSGA